MYIRWGTTSTSSFRVLNGVMVAFYHWCYLIYIYGWVKVKLNQSGIGGDIGGNLINH